MQIENAGRSGDIGSNSRCFTGLRHRNIFQVMLDVPLIGLRTNGI